MKTIALRFAENFAPECGTVLAHKELIDLYGYVWYGKLGTPISKKVADDIISSEVPKILLISSGKTDRYWAYVEKIQRETPQLDTIPEYYREIREKFKCWFRITKIIDAPKNVMSQCKVASSGRLLGEVSKKSMNPYFIIEVDEEA